MSVLTALVASKIVVGVVASGVAVTGAGAAFAYTGSLPASLQQVAHETIDAPAPAAGTGGRTSGVTSIEVATATRSPTLAPPVVVPPTEAANTLEPQKEAETHSADISEATEATEAPEVKETKAPDEPKLKSMEAPDPTGTPDVPSSGN
jgi:hypothetical protein